MPTPRKVNYLKDMKINEISLVTSPACPEADVLFTKAKGSTIVDKSFDPKEPRDEQGRWVGWGLGDVGRSAKGAARQVVQALSDRAKKIGETVVSRTVSGIKTTRPTGAYPVEGGGVQFDFEHRLNNQGAVYQSQVQIRPEHVAGETKAHRGLQRGLKLTHDILTTSNRSMQRPFSSTKRFSWLSGKYIAAPGAPGLFSGSGSGFSSALPPTSDRAEQLNEKRGPHGIPIHIPSEIEPELSRRIRGRAPAGAEPLPDATHETAGGKAHFYRGDFIPRTRPDIQGGIERVKDFLAANPNVAGAVKNQMRNTASGDAFFTERGDYVPPGNLSFQNQIRNAYTEHHRGSASVSTAAATPAARLFPPGHDREYPEDLRGLSHDEVFELKQRAEQLHHTDEAERLNAEISRRASHPPAGRAAGAFNASERFEKTLQTSGFDKAYSGRSNTKSSGSSLDYARSVAKSKIKRI